LKEEYFLKRERWEFEKFIGNSFWFLKNFGKNISFSERILKSKKNSSHQENSKRKTQLIREKVN